MDIISIQCCYSISRSAVLVYLRMASTASKLRSFTSFWVGDFGQWGSGKWLDIGLY